jgi:hypothetical protein
VETDSRKGLNRRALAALVALISGISLPFTGLALHLLHSGSPEGPRHFWVFAHEALGIIFTASAIWHIHLNRKMLATHLRGPSGRVAGISREAFWAVLAVGIVFSVAVGHTLFDH